MPQKYNVLIIDDHPIIVESYRNALQYVTSVNKQLIFKINSANNCDLAYQKIIEGSIKKPIDLIFLDISLPPSSDGKILSGEDLGLKIRVLLPDAKIIVATTYNNNYRIQNIFENINPEGFLVKTDITSQELVNAIQTVLNKAPYYSKTITQMLRKQVSNTILLDKTDRKILYELSIGTKMKDLPDMLPLTLAGIEKRKRRLLDIFEVETHDDKTLLLKAKEKGFI